MAVTWTENPTVIQWGIVKTEVFGEITKECPKTYFGPYRFKEETEEVYEDLRREYIDLGYKVVDEDGGISIKPDLDAGYTIYISKPKVWKVVKEEVGK